MILCEHHNIIQLSWYWYYHCSMITFHAAMIIQQQMTRQKSQVYCVIQQLVLLASIQVSPIHVSLTTDSYAHTGDGTFVTSYWFKLDFCRVDMKFYQNFAKCCEISQTFHTTSCGSILIESKWFMLMPSFEKFSFFTIWKKILRYKMLKNFVFHKIL
jgi:hypothetical protein